MDIIPSSARTSPISSSSSSPLIPAGGAAAATFAGAGFSALFGVSAASSRGKRMVKRWSQSIRSPSVGSPWRTITLRSKSASVASAGAGGPTRTGLRVRGIWIVIVPSHWM